MRKEINIGTIARAAMVAILASLLWGAMSAQAQVRFVPIPKFPTTNEAMAEFRQALQVPGNIPTFSTQAVIAGYLPAEGYSVKPWRDNAAIWRPDAASFDYVLCCDGEITLKLRTRIGDAGVPVTDAEGITGLEGLFTGRVIEIINRRFIQSGGAEFSRIPRLVRSTIDRAESQRLNILNPPAPVKVMWPVGVPLDKALRFNGDTVEAFDAIAYDKQYPLFVSSVGDLELVDSVKAILDSGMSVADQARAIRLLATKR